MILGEVKARPKDIISFSLLLNHVGVIFPQIWGKLSNGWFLDLLRLEG